MVNLNFQELIGFLMGPEMGEQRLGVCYPSIDVFENSNELCIEMELPGIAQEDVNVEILGRTLRISGTKTDTLATRDVRYVRMERSFGKFSRDLDIPERFNIEKTDAQFKNGVLLIKISRAVADNVEILKRIEVK